MPRLVKVREAAAHVGRTPRTIRNRVRRGEITGYLTPGNANLLVDLDEIEAEDSLAKRVEEYGPDAKIVVLSVAEAARDLAAQAPPITDEQARLLTGLVTG
jgi:hypothetical protein